MTSLNSILSAYATINPLSRATHALCLLSKRKRKCVRACVHAYMRFYAITAYECVSVQLSGGRIVRYKY